MNISDIFAKSFNYVEFILPFFIFVVLIIYIYKTWLDYVQTKFESNQKYSLLRIFPPQSILKTPAAMELFLNAIYQTGGESTWYDKKYLGKSRAKFSLEMASHGGEVAFYIRCRSGMRREVESQIYAQYPGIEVMEVDDYTDNVDYFSGNYSMFGVEYELTKEDPWPIKTYVDYGLDKVSEETEQVDPITNTLEFLGSLKSGEHAWIQIIVKAHKKEDKKPGTWFEMTDAWQDTAKTLIDEIKEKSTPINPDGSTGFPNLTEGQKDQIKAIERNISKPGFDTGIRSIYIAEKDVFDPVTIGALIGSLKQYSSLNLNGFKPQNTTRPDFPWQEWFGAIPRMEKQMFNDFKNRSFFGTTYIGYNYFGFPKKKDRKKFILNSEELATIYHFPSAVAYTPSLNRVQSKKGEAPANLPIQ